MFNDLGLFQKSIGYTFKNTDLLKQALTHSSYVNEHKGKSIMHYERLEFIGDAILEMVTSIKLYNELPQATEGELSKIRAGLVCEESLSRIADEKLKVSSLLQFGKGEKMDGGNRKASILCDVTESLIGAIYLDGGIDAASDFINRFVLHTIEPLGPIKDNKTALQELEQSRENRPIAYEIIDATGPDHERVFTAVVSIGGNRVGIGKGHSKKAAEQAAAGNALGLSGAN